MMVSITLHAHDTIKSFYNPNMVALDMTIGRGNDTLFLAKHCHKVFGFDIQEEAFKSTENLLLSHNIKNVELIFDSHEKISKYVKEAFSIAIFNLGYLPKASKIITTKEDVTLRTLKDTLKLISEPGLIVLTLYVGHEEGQKEALSIEEYVKTLSSTDYSVVKYQILNRNKSPYNMYIYKDKRRKK